MFVTAVAYDYYKAFVTAFIEINAGEKTIFGKPPMEKITPLVNLSCLIEDICYLLFSILITVMLAVPSRFSWWAVFWPFQIFLGFYFFFMLGLFLKFVYDMFVYGKSLAWKVCFLILIPLGLVNVMLFFGCNLLVVILFPIQQGTNLWQTPMAYDINLPLFLGMFGALLKSFVRPTDDDKNPFSKQVPTTLATVVYVLFFIGLGCWLIFLTSRIDGRLVLTQVTFQWNWWVVFIPMYLVVPMVALFFGFKCFEAVKRIRKGTDPEGDMTFKAAMYGILCFSVLMCFVSLILAIVYLVRLNTRKQIYGAAVVCIPLIIASVAMVILGVLPYVLKKRIQNDDGESNISLSKDVEMLSVL